MGSGKVIYHTCILKGDFALDYIYIFMYKNPFLRQTKIISIFIMIKAYTKSFTFELNLFNFLLRFKNLLLDVFNAVQMFTYITLC